MSSQTDPPPNPSKKQPQTINNPRRLLILSPPSHSLSIIPPLLHTLTGTPITDPPQQQTSTSAAPQPSFAGYTTHSPLRIETKYYTAEIPIWVDEVPIQPDEDPKEETGDSKPSSSQWRTEFLSPEAEIVREALGALVVAVRNPVSSGTKDGEDRDVKALRALMRDIGAVKECVDEERGGVGDVPGVFVLVGAGRGGAVIKENEEEGGLGDLGEEKPLSVGWWEDQLFDMGLVGWEVVEWDPSGEGEVKRNAFGEYEGMPRIKEVLETHEWTSTDADAAADLDAEFGFEDDLESELLGSGGAAHTKGFGQEVNELEREMLGLRMAIEHGGGDGEEGDFGEFEEGDEDIKVEAMEGIMMRMQALRDMGSDLPEAERKKFAAKAVQDIMKEL